jgi:hypothetical protein
MAKPKGKKKPSNTPIQSGAGRASRKPSKKNPKPNNYGANGKTIGGYSPAKLEERARKRRNLSIINISED